jgi:putative ABC transport system permease protein
MEWDRIEPAVRASLVAILRALTALLHGADQAMRSLTRAPGFTALTVFTLALGIASAVSVFAVTKNVLLDPLPFPEPDRLVLVWEQAPSGEQRNFVNAFNFTRWQARTTSFQALGLLLPIIANVSGAEGAEQVNALSVSSGFFDALAVKPLLGRTFAATDDTTRPPRVVVLSYGLWRSRFAAATNVLGQLVTVNGSSREIVGVMPPDFCFPAARAAELYTSFPLDPAGPPGGRNLTIVGRLRPGMSLDTARADLTRVTRQLAIEAPAVNQGWGASVFPLFDETVGSVTQTLWVVMGSVACLLLLTSTNIANLLLIRASRRAPEVALRAALGAGRYRLVQQRTVENLLLTMAAAAVGLAVAYLIVESIPLSFPQVFALPRAGEIDIDGTVVAVTLMVSLVLALVFTVMPAPGVAHDQLGEMLKRGSRSSSGMTSGVRRTLVIAEVAIALVLVFAATLMGRSLAELYSVNPGFETADVATLRMTLIPRKYARREQIPPFVGRVLADVRSIPGVVSASSVHVLPLSGVGSTAPVFRSDRPAPPRESWIGGPVSVVSSGYFTTLRIPLRGRDFTEHDRLDTPGVVIVSESLARREFPGEDPVGRHLKVLFGLKSDFEIIGVAGDVRTSTLEHAPEPAVYLSVNQEPVLDVALVVRAQDGAADPSVAVRAAIERIDPEQGVAKVLPLDTVITEATARPRLQAGVFGVFGALALVIAAVGLYGVVAYGVEQRRREMGILLALGAAPRNLLNRVVGDGLVLGAVGATVGATAAWMAGGVLEGLLYRTRPREFVTLFTVGAVLVLCAVLASLVPAIRAARVDPLVVLRNE